MEGGRGREGERGRVIIVVAVIYILTVSISF